MYSRDVAGQVRNFAASGSLYHSALVMKDSASGSYWAEFVRLERGAKAYTAYYRVVARNQDYGTDDMAYPTLLIEVPQDDLPVRFQRVKD